MALTATTLAAPFTMNQTLLRPTATTGATAGGIARVDNEYLGVIEVVGALVRVRRGIEGSKQVDHATLAPVVFGVSSDLPAIPDYRSALAELPAADMQSIGADGAIDLTKLTASRTVLTITKGSAAALTLAAPTAAQDGLQLTILSGSAFAHTVTYTAGFYGDTTGSDVATFAAKAGASFTIQARNGAWGVVALANVTIA